MQTQRRHTGPNCLTTRSRQSNGKQLLPSVDGRTTTARRYRDICRSYEAECGTPVSEVERDMIRQAAGLTLRAEQLQAAIVRGEAVDDDQLIRLSSTARRLLTAIAAKAAKRKPAAPGLADYVARKAAEKAAKPAGEPA